MWKLHYILIIFLSQSLFLNVSSFSQTPKKLAIGLSVNSGDHEFDFSLNVGVHYKKNYSQINLIRCVSLSAPSFDFWEAAHNPLKTSGLGFTQRYFPNKRHSRFAGFFHCDILYSNYSALKRDTQFFITKSYQRRLLGIAAGYGISLNFLHHITLLSSIDFGGDLIWGKDQFYGYSPNYITTLHRKEYVTASQLKFSILYCFKKF